jgi:hypothetical protein
MKYAEFEWIKRVIHSCETWQQLRTPITRLIRLFYDKYDDYDLVRLLNIERDNHKLYTK